MRTWFGTSTGLCTNLTVRKEGDDGTYESQCGMYNRPAAVPPRIAAMMCGIELKGGLS